MFIYQFLFSALPAAADYDRALESYLKEDYIQAALRFDRYVRQSPGDPKVALGLYYAAICRLRLEQPKPALERLESPLAVRPEGAPDSTADAPSAAMVRLAIGSAHAMLGNDTTALAYFESSWLSAANVFEREAAKEKIRERREPRLATPKVSPAESLRPLAGVVTPPARRPSRGAFVVQVASTPDRPQADSIRDLVARDGWPAYIESASLRGQTYHRVRVGPFADESDALDAKGRLQTQYGLEAWVTRK